MWVGVWVSWMEENEAVRMRCWSRLGVVDER